MNYTKEELRLNTRRYYAAVSGLDEQFGRLMEFMRQEGLYEDTVIVLSSDHGDMMGSHGLMGKHVWYEESIHIPFIVRVAGNHKRVCRTCIGSQDMMPTLLGLLGAGIPDTVEGEDCSRYILTEQEDLNRVSYLCACPGGEAVVRQFKSAGKDPLIYGWRGVRTQTHTYVMELGYKLQPVPVRYLYCTADDPQQQHPLDLAEPENRVLSKKLEESVMDWMRQQNDGFAGHWAAEAAKLGEL